MQVTVVLFGVFREKLAKESKGRLTLTLPDSATLADLLAQLQIQTHVICSVNGQLERDRGRLLKEGDEVRLMQAIGGGLT
jgi:sulfur carrier protein ThiS